MTLTRPSRRSVLKLGGALAFTPLVAQSIARSASATDAAASGLTLGPHPVQRGEPLGRRQQL